MGRNGESGSYNTPHGVLVPSEMNVLVRADRDPQRLDETEVLIAVRQ